MPLFILFTFLLGFTLLGASMAHAEDEENTGELKIESETVLYSANIYIKEEDQEVSQQEKKEDQKRDAVGIGETIKLKLTGKEKLIGDPANIEWKIEGSGADFDGESKGKKEVTLKISNELKENTSIKVKATTDVLRDMEENYKPPVKEFFIKVPNRITAQHARFSGQKKRGIPGMDMEGRYLTLDGWPEMAGASATLEVTFYPTNVNLQNIRVKEFPEDDNKIFPSLGEKHITAPPSPLGPGNRLYDTICSRREMKEIRQRGHKLSQNWDWDCTFKLLNNKDEELLILRKTKQFFNWEWANKEKTSIVVKVSKFDGCQTERNNLPDSKHNYTGGEQIEPTT